MLLAQMTFSKGCPFEAEAGSDGLGESEGTGHLPVQVQPQQLFSFLPQWLGVMALFLGSQSRQLFDRSRRKEGSGGCWRELEGTFGALVSRNYFVSARNQHQSELPVLLAAQYSCGGV